MSDNGSNPVTLDYLATLLRDMQADYKAELGGIPTELGGIRAEMRDMRAELKTDMRELRDDLETMLIFELKGRFGYFERQLDRRFDKLGDRITALEGERDSNPN